MKDKEKQIEEIKRNARIYIGAVVEKLRMDGCELHEIDGIVENILNYITIPEDSVVLTMEEYNEMVEDVKVSKEKLARIIDSAKEKGSKETAEKILSEIWHNNFETIITIKNSCSKEDFENIGKGILISIRNKLKEIATREGVEIKEKMYENN